MQTILGASGSVGTLLAKELANYTDKVRLVSRNPIKVNGKEELIKADLSSATEVDKAVACSEVVYVTIAFEYKYKVWNEKWLPFIKSVVDSCIKHNAKLVFFDNIYMYDKNYLSDINENSPINPSSRKGLIRMQVADYILNNIETGKLTALIARAPDFIAARNSILIETVYNNLSNGKKARWLGDAVKIHDFIYVPDAAKATAILGNSPDAYNQVWHLPTCNGNLTGKGWIELFANEINVEPKFSTTPAWMLGILGIFIPILSEVKEMMYQMENDYIFNSQKFQKQFNFTPTKPEVAVREIVRMLGK
ncbi:MAG: NAD-dependent epimerase/dehydratase family protein [Candidatus Kapabacteria bacterium]|nr:NAD-dependent epimerase/dehydratase family protein [Ignavibacteriota bacterium]MCW5885969.1 NAD-dependent epimerase/dehydratase family protein [Candidatus Kapabacteria bacterium]